MTSFRNDGYRRNFEVKHGTKCSGHPMLSLTEDSAREPNTFCKARFDSAASKVNAQSFGLFITKIAVTLGCFAGLFLQDVIAQEYNAVDRFPLVDQGKEAAKPPTSKILEKTQLFGEILSDIQNGYVEPVDLDQLSETAFQAMLSSLDPYTEFENPKAATQLAATTFGNYGGLGLEISRVQDKAGKDQPYVSVLKAYEGFAYDFGMRTGDRILEVCEAAGACKKTEGLELSAVSDLLKGKPESKVTLKFERPGVNGVQSLALTRQVVLLRDVPVATQIGDPAEGVAYVKLRGFSENAPIEVAYVLSRLESSIPLKTVVVDLRGNPGGLLVSAVQTANLFLPEGASVVTTKGRTVQAGADGASKAPSTFERTYRAKRYYSAPIGPDVKLILLVDERTASAAEILSGALQDHDRAVVMGRKTYGKGLIQQLDRLSGGTVLKYTAGKYFTPSGRCIQSKVYKGAGTGQAGTTAKVIGEADRRLFYTDSGRPVRDAGGIEPDVELPAPKTRDGGQLRKKLDEAKAFYNFADLWQGLHTRDGEALVRDSDKVVTDDVYRLFQLWVRQNVASLDSPFQKPLELMTEALKETGYDEAVPEVDELKVRLQDLLIKEFDTDAPAIRRRLEEAVRSRFLPESEVAAWQVRGDDEVALALELARSERRYLSIVTGPKPAVAAVPSSDAAAPAAAGPGRS